MNKTITKNAFLWFGAAISLAEILSGTLLKPLGMTKGIIIIIIGHLIGAFFLIGVGLIGAFQKLNAMESLKLSFGNLGSKFFAFLNNIQLIGWSAVMIITGAQACQLFIPISFTFWAITITSIILIWLLLNHLNNSIIVRISIIGLLIYAIWISFKLLPLNLSSINNQSSLSFIDGLELVIAMPLSWMPVIADYTKKSDSHPIKNTLMSVTSYSIGSIWMFIIGLIGSIFTNQSDVAMILHTLAPGIITLIIIILSTVTTTYLDLFSANLCWNLIINKNKKSSLFIITILSGLIALIVPMSYYEQFLYFIGAIFIPLGIIQCVDYFILKYKTNSYIDLINLIIWLIGFISYEILLNYYPHFGYTIPSTLIVVILCLLKKIIIKKKSLKV